MTKTVFEPEEEDDEITLEAEILESEPRKPKFEANDPFAAIPLSALNKNDKRRAQRLIKKFEGTEGAHAKYLTYEQINGYMLYGLASPPYNLDYLTYLGVEDPTNHACIETKAYSIVAQGYHWHETNKILLARQNAQLQDEQAKKQKAFEQQKALVEHNVSQQNKQISSGHDEMGNPKPATVDAPPMFEPDDSEDAKMLKLSNKLLRVKDSLDDKLDSWNIEDSIIDVLLKVCKDVEATGNGYIEVGRNKNQTVGYLGHVPANTMRVRIARDGYVQWVLPGYAGPTFGSASSNTFGVTGPYPGLTFFRNFGDTTTPDIFGKDSQPNEIIHISKYSTKSNYYGVPDIVSAIASVAGDKFAREYNLDYFENKAVPRYALIIKGAKLSTQSERKILDYFRKEIKGKHHGTLYIPVPGGINNNVDVKLEAIEASMQEGSFQQYHVENRTVIAMVHRVPLSMIGVHSSGGKGGMSAGISDEKNFKELVTGPEQARYESKLNKVIKEITDMFSFKFNEYDLVDEETRSRIHDRYVRIGVENSNDIRAELDMFPRKGGDAYLSPGMSPGSDANLDTGAANIGSGNPADMQDSPLGRPRQSTDGSPKNAKPVNTPANRNGLRKPNGSGGAK